MKMEGFPANGLGEESRKDGEDEMACQGTETSASGRWDSHDGLVGAYVGRKSLGIGRILLGKIVSYDGTGRLHRVIYEDGHLEDLERDAVEKILTLDEGAGRLTQRKRRLDRMVSSGGLNRRTTRSRKVTPDVPASLVQVSLEDVSRDADSSSDSCDHALHPSAASSSFSVETRALPLELPSSSGDIAVPEGSVSHLFSTYNFLRSFSLQLFLSPFGFDDYVGSLNCTVQNSLMDSIHLSLMRALGRHLLTLSSEGPNLASKCLRFYDWTLLDMLTWPAFLVEYLYVMGYVKELDSKEFINSVLCGEYYSLTVATKLKVLQLLCDDVINSGELRTELGMRVGVEEDNEECLDANLTSKGEPASLHHNSSKASGWMDLVVSGETVMLDCQQVNAVISEGCADGSANSQDKNSDECCLCGMDGTLICCDGCPSAYHSRCIGLNKAFLPDGLWFCPECSIDKLGSTSRMGRGAKGAEVFGIDLYGRMFVGSCNYLLVLDTLVNEESISRYYNQDDIPKVLSVISSSQENTLACVDISIGISEYFEIPMVSLNAERSISMRDTPDNKDDAVCNYASTSPRTINIFNKTGDISANNITACNLKHIVAKDEISKDPATPLIMGQTGILDAQRNIIESYNVIAANKIPVATDESLVHWNNEKPMSKVVVRMNPKVLPEQIEAMEKPGFGSVVTDLSHSNPPMPAEKSILLNNVAISSGNESSICKEDAYSSIYSAKNVSAGACYESKRTLNTCDVTQKTINDRGLAALSFKPLAYINQYIQGDIAASAAASLAVLSTKDSKIIMAHDFSNHRKVTAAAIALQMKAFSAAVMNFLWPCAEKKLMDIPRERCGWCIACKGPTTNKKGCLLNLAASSAIKGPAKNGNLRASKHHENHLPVIAAQLLIMEESLRGLMVGQFLDVRRNQWRKQVKDANNCNSLKALVLQLEKNIRGVAFSGGWTRVMDDLIEYPKSSNVVSRTGGNPRRGRPPKKQPEVVVATPDDNCEDLQWWRGGKLSKAVLQAGTIPSSLAKKAARQSGRRRISGISYNECSAYRRRIRQFAWRAAVEMSRSTSQLALQIRYLDAHIKWKEFTRPEQMPVDARGTETDAAIFRNVSISDKKEWESKTLYALNFGVQKHLPLRVIKAVLETERVQDGSEILWFSEAHVPLYLIKEYEVMRNGMSQLLPADFTASGRIKLSRRRLKFYWGDIFSYLTCKKENPVICQFCLKDVCLRYAAKCTACLDYCHMECSAPLFERQEDDPDFSRMCKPCHSAKTPAPMEISQRAISAKISFPGSNGPLLASRANDFSHSSATLLLSGKMDPDSDSKSSNLKTKRKGGAWVTQGIVWKRKKHSVDEGEEFRKEYLLPKAKDGSLSSKQPVCCLCEMPYNPNLMYVCCQTCKNWCHADAVLLDESKVPEVVGFKCCKCRRKSSPKCPYSEIGYTSLNNSYPAGSMPRSESSTSSLSDSGTDDFGMEESDPLELEGDASKPYAGPQLKLEDFDEWYASQIGNPLPPPPPEQQVPVSLEWGFDSAYREEERLPPSVQELAATMVMEFEPQTYFSFTELLASADDTPVLGGGGGLEFDGIECRKCGQCFPSPDLVCEVCQLCVHSHCSPWDEEGSDGFQWRCGDCREWR